MTKYLQNGTLGKSEWRKKGDRFASLDWDLSVLFTIETDRTMKTKIATFLFLLAIFEGCANRELQPLTLPDFTYRLKRQQLQGQPIPIPLVTPYDGDQQLRVAFIEGFKKGWNIALEYWLGNAIAIPEAYQHSAKLEKAWGDGCDAGQWALYRRVRPRSLDEEALVKTNYQVYAD